MRYSALAPGKRLRPVLLMAAAHAVGGEDVAISEPILDAACAVELVHCFSLIHDDLPAIDDDDLRRGRPTNHVQFGEAIAVLAGDALFALAFQVLARCKGSDAAVRECLASLSESSGSDGLVGGEVLDVLTEGRDFSEDELAFIHSRKTGVLIKACCRMGCILAEGSAQDLTALELYGDHVGLAFQIADDVLNETSTATQLGKAANSDALRRKATYPAKYGLEGAREAARTHSNLALKAVGNLATEELRYLATFAVERLN